jgi:hypothetical protein
MFDQIVGAGIGATSGAIEPPAERQGAPRIFFSLSS